MLDRLDSRVADVLARVKRGADVGGLLGPLEQDAARAERDLIVGASNRRADAHDEARARALRSELEARGAALRDLAARCVAQVAPAPRFAVPDVSALGPVPTDPAAVDAYLVRLDAVGRAMTMAQDAYASALSERDELRMTLGAYAAKAADRRASGGSAQADADLVELRRRAGEALDREPADLVRGRALLAAYVAYLGSTTRPAQAPTPRRRDALMSTTACVQPGCTGSILDGYCDVCGSPGPSGAATASPSAVSASAASPPAASASAPSVGGVAGRCAEPGCSGTVVDGYCDVCGTPGRPGPRRPLPGEPARPPPPGPRSRRHRPASPSRRRPCRGRPTSSRRPPSGPRAPRAGGSKVTRRVGTSSTRLRGARLGAGLTSIPAVPAVDAAKAVLENPMVPEDRRTCPNCGSAVGRSRDGQPGRTEGFCPTCRNPFSFTPKLKAGDVVGGQYVVAGAIAHGGLGWIYAARDRNVSDRWVVLKGLLNSGDPDALAAAIAERQFLAQVEHPLIVEIYNFVTHEGAGYIVMEYVGGTSLKQLLKDRMRAAGGVYDPLPVDQAIAFIVEVLPAFQYLHDLGLVFCDFKPDNLIQVGDGIKLIDLGGVRRLDDLDSAIYGTTGYQAPEVPLVGPSVASDIYTIGRTLIVLAMEFRGYQSTYVASLPPVDQTPLFREHDSFYRLLLKACAPDPADRFVSADELRVQLLGVLREVVGAGRERRGRALHVVPALRRAHGVR